MPFTSAVVPTARRCTLLFVTAYMLTLTSHEIIHALVAYALGFRSTLFHLWVTPDAANASHSQIVMISSSGPIGGLVIGAICWIRYMRRRGSSSELLTLLLAIMGTYGFLGTIVGAAFGGDANTIMRVLGMPMLVRHSVSVAGAIGLASFMAFAGCELVRTAPAEASRARAVMATVVAPWLIGTVLAVVLYLPLPPPLIASTIAGSAFWMFAVIGAVFGRAVPHAAASMSMRAADLALAVAALVVVRVLASGVRLEP